MLNESNLGAAIKSNLIPFSNKAKKLIRHKVINRNFLLTSGDDYELIFTANSKKSLIIKKLAKKNNIKITKVGKTIQQKGVYLDKIKINTINKSFQHFS